MKLDPWPYYDKEQKNKCLSVLESGKVNYWTGDECKNFENEFSKYLGVKYAITHANGSLALSSAYLGIGLGKGDEFITSPRTFIATSASAVLLGAKPIFADVDRYSGCITAESIEAVITPRTKAISVVHFAGWPADMVSICQLAKSYNIPIIEDCAQAHGARIIVNGKEKFVGSFGDVAAWSFCQDKIISTGGEGGMVSTSNKKIYDAIWSFKDHGKTREAIYNDQKIKGFRWLHKRLGSNFRLTELQSSIGRIQLKRLNEWIKIRTHNANILAKELEKISLVRVPMPNKDTKHAWYKFYCFINEKNLISGWDRNRIISEINERGYPAFHGGCSEIYLEKCFENILPSSFRRLPVAKELGETSLMFLVHPTISPKKMNEYAEVIKNVLISASK